MLEVCVLNPPPGRLLRHPAMKRTGLLYSSRGPHRLHL